MIRLAFPILMIFSLLTASCTSRKSSLDKKNIIPEKELVSILTDIHIADGLLALPRINSMFSNLDSIATYYQVIEKHGYTKEIMDKTMKYYFLNNPKKLAQIYDEVLVILSEMDSRIEKESVATVTSNSNLWTGRDYYSVPSLSGKDSTRFDINLNKPGHYTFAFSATLFPDDQSVNPRLTVFTCSPDSINTGKKHYLKSTGYIKDGRPHKYSITIIESGSTLHLAGWFFDFENHPFGFERHYIIENISLTTGPVQ